MIYLRPQADEAGVEKSPSGENAIDAPKIMVTARASCSCIRGAQLHRLGPSGEERDDPKVDPGKWHN